MALRSGDKFGEYEIVSLLGQGGMGEVYKARDSSLKRDVAIKVMRGVMTGEPERMARFQREAEVLASLDHPNIGPIYGVADSGDARGLVLALIDGPTLADRIALGPIGVDEAIGITRQIVAALEYAHECGVVHRDLKPANVKVNAEGVVKVLDFGLAKVVELEAASGSITDSPTLTHGHTMAGMILGTAAYMSPEQAVGRTVDRRSDIFAMGSVLFEMLTGRQAFGGGSVPDVLEAVVSKQPDLGLLPTGTPIFLRQMIERMLVKDRKQRMQAIGEARIALERQGEAPVARTATQTGVVWKAAAAVLALLTVGLAFVVYQQMKKPEVGAAVLDLRLSDGEAALEPARGTMSISPDGKRFTFVARGGLWVRDLDSASARKIAEIPEARFPRNPAWSPDSRSIVYFAAGRLVRIAASGGPGVVIGEIDDFRNAALNQKDIVLAANREGVWRFVAAGSKPERVLELDRSKAEDSASNPDFLPDGRHFIVSVQKGDRAKSAIYLVDLETKVRTLLLEVPSNAVFVEPGYLLYVKNRTLVAHAFDTNDFKLSGDPMPLVSNVDYQPVASNAGFSASRTGSLVYSLESRANESQLTWLDRQGKVLGTVGGFAEQENFSLSMDDSMVVSTRNNKDTGLFDLWQHDLTRRSDSRLTNSGNNRFPLLLPDGKEVAFDSGFNNERHMYRMALGSGTKPIIFSESTRLPMSFSSDGRYLLAGTPNQTPVTGNDIWVLPQFDGRKPYAYLATKFAEGQPRPSPDGRWLAYSSNESGEREVYVGSFPEPGEKWRISTGGGGTPVWSRDGKELYYQSSNNEMMAVDVKSGASFEYGVPKALFQAEFRRGNKNFQVSRDGRFLVDVMLKDQEVPVKVILNWPALLKK